MSRGLPKRIILTLLLLAGCGKNVNVLPTAGKAESRELTPIEFNALEFVHHGLRTRLQRIDFLARTLGLPEENTLEWSRRPPNANDGRKLLADIEAGRRLRLGKYVYTTTIPDPSQREFREFEVPESFKLTAEERRVFTAKATAWAQSQQTLLEEDHEEMYAAILRAFPIDEYFAAEPEADEAVTDPGD